MARPARVVVPGIPHHVPQRGNRRRETFFGDDDYQACGALMARSSDHRHLFLADLEWRVLPPIALGQCRLIQKDGQPYAFVTWASVSEEVETRLKSGGERRLKPEDWKSGDRRLVVDVVSPFGNAEAVLKEVREKVFGEN